MRSNKLSIDLNKRIKQAQPSLRTIGKWREEWIAKGLDFKCTFQSYKKKKCIEWNREKYERKINAKK